MFLLQPSSEGLTVLPLTVTLSLSMYIRRGRLIQLALQLVGLPILSIVFVWNMDIYIYLKFNLATRPGIISVIVLALIKIERKLMYLKMVKASINYNDSTHYNALLQQSEHSQYTD